MKKLLSVLFFFASVLTVFARDDQIWVRYELSAKLWKGLGVKLEEELEFDNHHLFLSETFFMTGWTFNPYVSIWAGYKLLRERPHDTGHYATDHCPMADVILTSPTFAMLRLDFRSRFECHDRADHQPYMRYRERLRLRTTWGVTDFHFSPYVSGEMFLDDKPKKADSELFSRTRTEMGFTFHPLPSSKELTCTLFFMVQHDMKKRSAWDPTNVYGFTVSYAF